MSLKWSSALAALAASTALALPLWPTGAAGKPGGWAINVGGGLSEARALGERGGRLIMSCATYGGSALPRYSIRLEGPAHGGRPLKAQLDVGPTHLNLDLSPTPSPTTSAWTARNVKDQRAYRALAARIRASHGPLKIKWGDSTETFPAAGAREVLGTQALQCLT